MQHTNPVKTAVLENTLAFKVCDFVTPDPTGDGVYPLAPCGREILINGPTLPLDKLDKLLQDFHTNPAHWDVVPQLLTQQMTLVGEGGSVNISPAVIAEEQYRIALRAVLKQGRRAVYPNRTLEIIERAKLTAAGIAFLEEMYACGYDLALDDLGAGVHKCEEYVESLLQELPIRKLKIDCNLILGKSPKQVVSIVNDLIGLYRLEMSPRSIIVVEGITTLEDPEMYEAFLKLKRSLGFPIWAQLPPYLL